MKSFHCLNKGETSILYLRVSSNGEIKLSVVTLRHPYFFMLLNLSVGTRIFLQRRKAHHLEAQPTSCSQRMAGNFCLHPLENYKKFG